MEWDKNNIEQLVNYINNQLQNGRTMKSIEIEEFEVAERVINKRLLRLGYKKVEGVYSITGNITPIKATKEPIQQSNVNTPITPIKANTGAITGVENAIDTDKLNLLLNNLDNLLKLIPTDHITSNITGVRSGVNNVISLRADTGLYAAIKERANRDNLNISDLVNRALEDYLNNYL